MSIQQIVFSPTGGTRRVSEILCHSMGENSIITDLCVKACDIKLPVISKDDLVVIAMPVFAGRVPALVVERLKQVQSNSAKCVIVAVYGNRDYDDALLEMQDVATAMGFRVIAAVGAVAEHSIARMYGTGRPDEDDAKELSAFGAAIMRKFTMNDCSELSLPGNRPYRQGSTGPFPEANDQCNGCGICAHLCPADAISLDNLRTVNKDRCIGCMRCVSVCPVKARGIGPVQDAIAERLKPVCSERKRNEMFI